MPDERSGVKTAGGSGRRPVARAQAARYDRRMTALPDGVARLLAERIP